MNIEDLQKCNLITKNGNINSAVLRRKSFLESDAYIKIKKCTNWLDDLNPSIGIRIKSILLDFYEISYCPHCSMPCEFSTYRDKMFRKTCGSKVCINKESKYERTDAVKNRISSAIKNNHKNKREYLMVFHSKIPDIDIDDEEILSYINVKMSLRDNACLVKESEYIDSKEILSKILRKTSYIPINLKDFKWSQRMYNISMGLSNTPHCECGKDLHYQNRKVGYTSMCHSCLIKNGPKARARKSIESIRKYISNDYDILNDVDGLNYDKILLKHIQCGYSFKRWINNGRWKDIKCPKCDSQTSKIEKEIQNFVNKFSDIRIRETVDGAEIDILDSNKKIGIEINGNYWHSELQGKGKRYHVNKTDACKNNDIRLIHIFESEMVYKSEIVKNRLKYIFGGAKYKIYGRLCTIKEIDTETKKKFLNKYHIQGDAKSLIKLGAFYKNRLVAVMTFGKRRFDNKDGYELIRYATISNFSCVGVAGKLLKHFESTYNPTVIVSYADRRWSEGNLYKQLGFKHIHNSSPNYFYFKKNDTLHLMSRIQFQKHKLKNKLKYYNPTLTEWENMKANGYDRIWDCGNMVFEKTY